MRPAPVFQIHNPRDEVASSASKMGAFFNMARAMAIR